MHLHNYCNSLLFLLTQVSGYSATRVCSVFTERHRTGSFTTFASVCVTFVSVCASYLLEASKKLNSCREKNEAA